VNSASTPSADGVAGNLLDPFGDGSVVEANLRSELVKHLAESCSNLIWSNMSVMRAAAFAPLLDDRREIFLRKQRITVNVKRVAVRPQGRLRPQRGVSSRYNMGG
jgi:hypothetical protein